MIKNIPGHCQVPSDALSVLLIAMVGFLLCQSFAAIVVSSFFALVCHRVFHCRWVLSLKETFIVGDCHVVDYLSLSVTVMSLTTFHCRWLSCRWLPFIVGDCHVVDNHRRFLYCRRWKTNAVSCIVTGYHWVRLCEFFLAGIGCLRLRSLSTIVVGWHIASFIVIDCHHGLLRCRCLPSFLLIVADCLSLLLLLLVSVCRCFCCWRFLCIVAFVFVGFYLSLLLLLLVSVYRCFCCCWFLSIVAFVVVGFCLSLLLLLLVSVYRCFCSSPTLSTVIDYHATE